MSKPYLNIEELAWQKMHDLIPAIIQDSQSLQVLMLGYMNKEALTQTRQEGRVIFYSRSKQRLWQKGEISGNELELIDIIPDCDNDALLVLVNPLGACCHLKTTSCFAQTSMPDVTTLFDLEKLIAQRQTGAIKESYTASLFEEGHYRIAQKVGEEAVEVALASVKGVVDEIKEETADLLFHLLVLLRNSQVGLLEVFHVLRMRMQKYQQPLQG